MQYITEGVIRSLKKDEIEYNLKKILLGKLFIIKEEELKISKISFNKYGLVFGFKQSHEELVVKNVRKIEVDHKSNTVRIISTLKRYTIQL